MWGFNALKLRSWRDYRKTVFRATTSHLLIKLDMNRPSHLWERHVPVVQLEFWTHLAPFIDFVHIYNPDLDHIFSV